MPPRILIILRQETAVGYYRQELPSPVLKSLGYTVDFDPIPVFSQKPSTNDWLLQRIGQYDIVLVDRGGSLAEIIGDPNTTPPTIGYRGIVDASPNCRMICDFDDNFLDLPKWNESRKLFMPGMAYHVAGLAHLQLSEMTTVSTPSLLTTFTKRTHAIRCAPNHIDPADWAHPTNPARSNDPRLRIFYGGASGHYGDLAKCETALKHLLASPPVPFRFIAFNAIPRALHDIRRQNPKAVVSLPWVPFYDTQPGYLNRINFDDLHTLLNPTQDNLAPTYVKPYSGLRELFRALSELNIKLGIFTSGTAHHIVRNFGIALPELGLSALYDENTFKDKEKLKIPQSRISHQ